MAVFSLALVFALARCRSLDRRPQATACLRDNYFLVIVVVALMGIYALQTDLIWDDNNTDDGFYLVKSATLPYLAARSTLFTAPDSPIRPQNSIPTS